MFSLQDTPIDVTDCRCRLARADAGACVTFEGWVRNHHRGRSVTCLEYESFGVLAQAEGDRIVADLERRHPGARALGVHRTGRLEVGELAVWLGATAAHRGAAFAACRDLIEELKRSLPVWKKEFFGDGTSEWVNCTTEHNPSRSRDDYHSRFRQLQAVGASGLDRLARARVLVVGAGGLGSAALETLAGSGIGAITLVDSGRVELSNLHRQTLYAVDDLDLTKAAVATRRLTGRNPFLQVEAHAVTVDAGNVAGLIAGHEVVLDCSDNFATRCLLHEACRAACVPLVQAAVLGFEGSINTFVPGAPGCLRCLWGANPVSELEQAVTSAGMPVFGGAAATLGCLQGAEAIKRLLGLPVPSQDSTLLVDLLDMSITRIGRRADPACPVCAAPAFGGAVTP